MILLAVCCALACFLLKRRRRIVSEGIVLITGGSSGIGWALATRLADRGMKVAIADVKEPMKCHENIIYHKLDISDRQAVNELRDLLEAKNLSPTILVNNAGIARPAPFLQLQYPEHTMAVNCMAHFWTLQAFLPAMQAKQEGHIICVASCLGLGAVPYLADYCASKAAIIALSESIRLEFSWLTVTCVCPFLVNTDLFSNARLRFPWLLPPLSVERVVDEICYAIDTRFNGDLWLPHRLWPFPLIRLMPWWVYSTILKWSGGCDALL